MNTTETAYGAAMSQRYDEDFEAIFGSDDRGDLPFFVALAQDARGPICEVGAGTGRVALPVLGATDQVVTAVEPSAAMRVALEGRLAEAPEAARARMAVTDGRFDALPLASGSQALVYSAFRSFQHVLEVDTQRAALEECRRVLAPGGVLAIDLFDPDYRLLRDAEPQCVVRYRTPRGTVVERWDGRRIDRVAQRVDVDFRWVERVSGGGPVRDDVHASYAIRYTFPVELRHLLALAGFAEVALYGDYDRTPVDARPRELIAVARVG